MAFRSLNPADTIAARFSAMAPADLGVAAGRDVRIAAGAGADADAIVGNGPSAATGQIPSDPVSDLDADIGVRVDELINLIASIWQPAPLVAAAAAHTRRDGPAWLDASHWARSDAAATTSSRLHVLRGVLGARAGPSSRPVQQNNASLEARAQLPCPTDFQWPSPTEAQPPPARRKASR